MHPCASFPISRQHGIAISLILAGIALLVAMGVLITYSTRLGASLSQHNSDVAEAMILINQARTLREGIRMMVARGAPLESISLDANDGATASSGYTINTTGLYHPSLGGTEPQIPPRNVIDANFSGASSTYYTWHLITDGAGNPMVKLYNVGTSAADLVIALVGINGDICQQLNTLINNTPLNTAPPKAAASGAGHSVASDWGSRPSATLVDFSTLAAMNQMEQCIRLSDNTTVYYTVVKVY